MSATSLFIMVLAGFLVVPRTYAVQIVASQDTWITELAPDVATGGGTAGQVRALGVRSSNPAGQNVLIYLQFDISSLTTDAVTASLNLTANRDHSLTYIAHFFGAFEADAGVWDETTTTWNNAAVLFPDGVNLPIEISQGHALLDLWDLVPNGDTDDSNALVTALGSGSFSSDLNQTMSFSSAPLVSFLNTARTQGDTTVTLLLAVEPHDVNTIFQFYSKDATDDLGIEGVDTLLTDAMRPNLAINEVPPVVPGDFDADGDVDGADFVVWQTNFPTATGATLETGDADGDGDVDGADFVVWQTNFPTTPGSGVTPVPEPASVIVAMLGGIIALAWRQMRKQS